MLHKLVYYYWREQIFKKANYSLQLLVNYTLNQFEHSLENNI